MIPQRDNKINEIKYGLYVVSTPIGNLKDITLRAIEILKQSEYILCEDTRVSKNLLEKYNIKSKLISNHKFNEKKNLNKIIYFMLNDKKNTTSKINLILLGKIGRPLLNKSYSKIELKSFLQKELTY